MKQEIKWVDRADFVKNRYENWLRKKQVFAETMPQGSYHMSDLDRIYEGETKPLKDIVVCDSCNEDILEPKFVMVEEQLVYHAKCTAHLPKTAAFREQEKEAPTPLPANVIIFPAGGGENRGNE